MKWTSSTGPQSLISSSETQEALGKKKKKKSSENQYISQNSCHSKTCIETEAILHHFFYPSSISTNASLQKCHVRLSFAILDLISRKMYCMWTITTILKPQNSECSHKPGPKYSR